MVVDIDVDTLWFLLSALNVNVSFYCSCWSFRAFRFWYCCLLISETRFCSSVLPFSVAASFASSACKTAAVGGFWTHGGWWGHCWKCANSWHPRRWTLSHGSSHTKWSGFTQRGSPHRCDASTYGNVGTELLVIRRTACDWRNFALFVLPIFGWVSFVVRDDSWQL